MIAPNTDYLRPDEAAPYILTTPGTLAQWRYRGTGPAYAKLGRNVVYRKGDLDAYIEANLIGGAA